MNSEERDAGWGGGDFGEGEPVTGAMRRLVGDYWKLKTIIISAAAEKTQCLLHFGSCLATCSRPEGGRSTAE